MELAVKLGAPARELPRGQGLGERRSGRGEKPEKPEMTVLLVMAVVVTVMVVAMATQTASKLSTVVMAWRAMALRSARRVDALLGRRLVKTQMRVIATFCVSNKTATPSAVSRLGITMGIHTVMPPAWKR